MHKPRHLLALSTEEKRTFLDSIDHVFSDIDGVVWNVTEVIDGSSAGFQALRDVGKKLTFVTNNSVRPEEQCLAKLKKTGIEIDADNLIHPGKSIAEYLTSIKFEGLIYAIASNSIKDLLRNEGFQVKEGPHVIIEESLPQLIANVVDSEPVKAVVIDFDFNLTLTTMMKANFYLRRPDCLLIGGATDYILPATKDMSFMGPGGFLKALEDTSGKEMLIFGKPGKALADILIKRFEIKETNRALMIGDMLEQDIRFGKMCNFQTLLVLTSGMTPEELCKQTDPNLIPDYYVDSMGDFVQFINDIKKSNA
ncbi:glycerol-3-phosphate phosphatase [Stomoxys calcitrans]|uniref:Pyridoxal phosphate phosphatase n=1 Tax=Stomoxys calcitrans TaxID=35570 RepID=A0A1I8PYG2_STOCA|nr:glycerol-3-phosphate phosphatase [Stomoxys calcitrans]XP_013115801.1 glycerol-3-phosphate phosphatase [Stomoxys calcitrans]